MPTMIAYGQLWLMEISFTVAQMTKPFEYAFSPSLNISPFGLCVTLWSEQTTVKLGVEFEKF
jgi:hypothetical protein